jgi:hypothetical protein
MTLASNVRLVNSQVFNARTAASRSVTSYGKHITYHVSCLGQLHTKQATHYMSIRLFQWIQLGGDILDGALQCAVPNVSLLEGGNKDVTTSKRTPANHQPST